MLDRVPVMAEKPNHFWFSCVNAETKAGTTLIKDIMLWAWEVLDSFKGLRNVNDSLRIQVTLLLGLPLPHKQYNNRRTIYWYAVKTKNGKVWDMVIAPVTSTKEGGHEAIPLVV